MRRERSASTRVLLAALGVAMLAACTSDSDDATSTITTTAPAATTTTTESPVAGPGAAAGLRPVQTFAAFPDIPLLADAPPYAGPDTPTSLDGVLWADQVPDAARAQLAANGFVVVESSIGQFHEAYSAVEMTGRQPVFVTTDAAYHYWHLVFSKALRDTEQLVLLPILQDFAQSLYDAAQTDADALHGTAVEADAQRVERFTELLVALLELGDGPFDNSVEEELGLIRDHVGFSTSPTTGTIVDYSLFAPRGHYTSTPELTRYFQAMSALGQTGFLLRDTTQLRAGLLLAREITGHEDLRAMWTQLYEPTAFLVGLADDYTPLELADAADRLDPAWRDAPDRLDDALVTATAAELESVRDVAIDPDMASMRVMGARLVLDSYILDQLVHPSVQHRLEGSPLDVAAAFGSDWARGQQTEAGVPDEFPEYGPQLDAMTTLVDARRPADWGGTVYDAWLYALQPMWRAHGTAYPDFMRTAAWAAKAHSTGFGSYTELKHDTVLYAKQAFAEGEAPVAPAEPRHWVEPEPVVYGRLAAVVELLRSGLGSRQLLSDEVDDLLDRLADMYVRFERLARDELTGAPISDDDNEWLESIAARFELLWLLTAEDADESATTSGIAQSPDDIAAVISDVMSNPNDALEVATGYVDQLFVLVPNDDGVFQVARGGVYSYYEFWVPRGERRTDEEWRATLASGEQPERPVWTGVFTATP